MKASISKSLFLTVALLGLWHATAAGQVPDGVARRKIDELRQNDRVLQSEISSVRVDRQVEITRLEGRIARLEKQLRSVLPPQSGTSQLAFVLGLLDSEPTSSGSADEKNATPDKRESLADSPSQEKHSEVVQLVVQDYILALEIETLDARALLLEKSKELNSLERLSAKGLASAPQLDLQVIEKQRAELQLKRLGRQLDGLRRLHPRFFE